MQHLTAILCVCGADHFASHCIAFFVCVFWIFNENEHMSQNLLFLIDCEIFKQVKKCSNAPQQPTKQEQELEMMMATATATIITAAT